MRSTRSYQRWLIIAFATFNWGWPLSVLAEQLGYDSSVGWLAGLISVLLGDLFCFIWWRSLEDQSLRRVPVPRQRR